MATTDIPEPDEIATDLRTIVRTGLVVSRLKDLSVLFDLAIVATQANGNRPLDRAIALEKVIREAAANLGEGPTGQAVELLMGMTPRSRGLLVKDRRDLAAEVIGIETETFRKTWERQLIGELADEVYKIEAECRVPVRVKPRKRRGPVLQDFARSGDASNFGRREAEARLWSLGYAVRADLLAVGSIRKEIQKDPTEALDASLWSFTCFIESMATYTEEFGTALVVAGNEVTVHEAASLLRIHPPLTDDQALTLRLALKGASQKEDFMRALCRTDEGSAIIKAWRRWLA